MPLLGLASAMCQVWSLLVEASSLTRFEPLLVRA
jgi:hypothetical protein